MGKVDSGNEGAGIARHYFRVSRINKIIAYFLLAKSGKST
jgi:hypothetical protein